MTIRIHTFALASLGLISSPFTLAQTPDRDTAAAQLLIEQQRPDLACSLLGLNTPPDSRDAMRFHLLGECSAAQGKTDVAIEFYQRAIELRPEAPAPRAALASLLLAQGRSEESARLFAEAADRNGDSDGSTLMRSIAERLRNNDPAALAAQQSKPWSVQLYTGLVHDSNVNGGPVSRNVPAILGGVPISFELVEEAMPRSSAGAALGLTASYIVPLAPKWGLMLQGAYFGTGYFSEQDFGNDSLALSGAFIYRDKGFSASIQPNLRYTRMDGNMQEINQGVTTRLSQQINRTVMLTGSLGYFDRTMPVAHDRDAQVVFGSVGANWQALSALQVGGEYLWQRERAEVNVYSRRSDGPSLFAAYRFTPAVTVIGNYAYSKSNYDERMALFAAAREDTQKTASLTALWDISRWAGRNMVVRAQYTTIDNPSNIAYNRFKRDIVGVGIQMMF